MIECYSAPYDYLGYLRGSLGSGPCAVNTLLGQELAAAEIGLLSLVAASLFELASRPRPDPGTRGPWHIACRPHGAARGE